MGNINLKDAAIGAAAGAAGVLVAEGMFWLGKKKIFKKKGGEKPQTTKK